MEVRKKVIYFGCCVILVLLFGFYENSQHTLGNFDTRILDPFLDPNGSLGSMGMSLKSKLSNFFDDSRMINPISLNLGIVQNISRHSIGRSQESIPKNPMKTKHVCVCFFGQVKNYSHVAHTVQKHILDVLVSMNITYDVFAHTYNQSKFANKRNKEAEQSIDPFSLQRVTAGLGFCVGHDRVRCKMGARAGMRLNKPDLVLF